MVEASPDIVRYLAVSASRLALGVAPGPAARCGTAWVWRFRCCRIAQGGSREASCNDGPCDDTLLDGPDQLAGLMAPCCRWVSDAIRLR